MFEVRLSYCIGFAICFFFICGLLINQGFFFYKERIYNSNWEYYGKGFHVRNFLFFIFYGFDH
jgi:hypothetical protein